MTVQELITHLSELNPDSKVRMCMDWSAQPESAGFPSGQWEDALGDVAVVSPGIVVLLNENFK